MKIFAGVFLLFAIATFTFYLFVSQSTDVNKDLRPVDRPNLRQLIEGRGAHEYLYTHDPATKSIPKERLLVAKEYTRRLLSQKAAIPNVNWVERGPNNVSGRTRAILIDAADGTGNTIFAGGVGGGLWRTTDGGTTWTEIDAFLENLSINGITQDVNNASIIYFGTGEGFGNGDAIRGLGIWKSIDGGASFAQLAATNNTSSFYYVNSMAAVDSSGTTIILCANSNSGVHRSIDGGVSWTQVLAGDGKDLSVASNGDIYAGMDNNNGIWKSTNHGETWTKVYAPFINAGRIELATAPSNSSIVYAIIENTGGGEATLRKTTDGGATWPAISIPRWNDQNCQNNAPDWTRGQDWYDLIAAVDPNNPNRVFIGAIDLFVTADGGTSWTQVSSWVGGCGRPFVHADQHALVFAGNDSNVLWSGGDGGVFKSEDATAAAPDFEFKGEGYNVTQFYACDIHPTEDEDYFLAGAQDNGTQQFTSAGLNDTNSATGGDGGFCHIDQDDPNIQMTSFTSNNYSISTNGGASFASGPSTTGGQFINPTDYDDNLNRLYGAFSGGAYFRWNDPATGGSNFNTVTVSEFAGTSTHVRVSPNIADRVYFGGGGQVVRVDGASTGLSNTGTVIFTGFGNGTISCVEIEIGNEDHIIVTRSNYGVISVFETTNGTSATPTWTNIENNLPDIPVRWAMFNPGNSDQLLLATELGVWSTDNLNGASTDWTPTNTGFANTRIDMLKFRESDQVVIAASHGRGLFSTIAFNNKLFFTKTAVTTGNALDTIMYNIDILNNKTTSITNVTITDVLDTGLVFVNGSLTCGTFTAGTITILEANMTPGATLNCSFKAVAKHGNFSDVFFSDDIESGTANWTVVNGQGAGIWSVSGANPNSPVNSWFAPNTGTADNTEYLISDPIVLQANSQLGFWHDYDTEFGWDGGIIEISTDGGTNWIDLGPMIISNGYNSVLGVNANLDIANRPAFSGSSDGYIFTTVDLSSYGTQSVQFRFLFGEDDNTSEVGWFVDDVQVYEAYSIPNIACITSTEGDMLCDTTSTLIFECVVDCFTCVDNIQNGQETGVDCGGPSCTPCDCTDVNPDLVYDNTNIPDGTDKRIKNSISTTNSVNVLNGSTVILRAGNSVDFGALFEIVPGAIVDVVMDDCTIVPPRGGQ